MSSREIDRRKFLEKLGILIGGTSAFPACAVKEIAIEQKTIPSRNIFIEYVPKTDDYLSEDYDKRGDDSLISEGIRRANELYSDVMGLNIYHDVFDKRNPDDIHFRLDCIRPGTFNEKMLEGEKHPLNMVFGDEYEARAFMLDIFYEAYKDNPGVMQWMFKDEEVLQEIKNHGSYKDYANQEVITKLKNELDHSFAVSFPGTRRIFLRSDICNSLPMDDSKIRERVRLLLGYSTGHQMGHIMGLDHLEYNGKGSDRYNVMRALVLHDPDNWLNLDYASLNGSQKKRVADYIAESRPPLKRREYEIGAKKDTVYRESRVQEPRLKIGVKPLKR
jgi:hypothetical protein